MKDLVKTEADSDANIHVYKGTTKHESSEERHLRDMRG